MSESTPPSPDPLLPLVPFDDVPRWVRVFSTHLPDGDFDAMLTYPNDVILGWRDGVPQRLTAERAHELGWLCCTCTPATIGADCELHHH